MHETISPLIDLLRVMLERRAAAGQFRSGVHTLDFYVTLVGIGYYIMANCFTVRAFRGRNHAEPLHQARSTELCMTSMNGPSNHQEADQNWDWPLTDARRMNGGEKFCDRPKAMRRSASVTESKYSGQYSFYNRACSEFRWSAFITPGGIRQ